MKKIELTEEEYNLLIGLVHDSLMEYSPTPTLTMKSLAIKLQMDPNTMRWINRMLHKEETKDEKDVASYNKYDFVYTYHEGHHAVDIPFVVIERNEWEAKKQAETFIKREYPNIYDPYGRIALKGERKGWK